MGAVLVLLVTCLAALPAVAGGREFRRRHHGAWSAEHESRVLPLRGTGARTAAQGNPKTPSVRTNADDDVVTDEALRVEHVLSGSRRLSQPLSRARRLATTTATTSAVETATGERMPLQETASFMELLQTREQRRAARLAARLKTTEGERYRQLLEQYREATRDTHCAMEASSFCRGLLYAYSEFVACSVRNRERFVNESAPCRETFVDVWADCAGDMVTFCPTMSSDDALTCLCSEQTRPHLSVACLESEIFEVIGDFRKTDNAETGGAAEVSASL